MDLVKTGQFLADLRKMQGLTQEQLGEKMGVTNKTISRWETGTYLPPAEMLMQLSELYSVSINELLSGKRLSEHEYKEAAEENIKNVIRTGSFSLDDRMKFYKKKWLREHIGFMIFSALMITGVFLAGLMLKNQWMISGAVLLLLIFHGVRNNAMMAYAEQNAFDGRGR